MPRKVLATIGSGPAAPVLEQALSTIRPYARRHGYEVVIGEGDSQGRPPAWAKVPLIGSLLQEYDEVLWLDADLVILDGSVDIAAVVPDTAFQALVEMQSDGHRVPNTGVWFLRASERAQDFLAEIWASTDFINHKWWENAAAVHLLGYELDPGRGPVADSIWMSGTHWLPEEWNSLTIAHGLGPARIRHYASTDNKRRVEWIKADTIWAHAQEQGWTAGTRARYAALASKRFIHRHVPTSGPMLKAKATRRLRLLRS
jgi:hypothetical protein